jgi:hypothetical protein
MNFWLEKAERERDLRQAATRRADMWLIRPRVPLWFPLPGMARS